MKNSGKKLSLTSYDDIFTTEDARQENQRERVMEIPLDKLQHFRDHPFQVRHDQALQDMIGEFNLKRVSLNQEVQKADKDQEKLNQLDREIKELYQKIMSYPKMVVYNGAKKEVDSMMNYINRILVMSVNGEDPDSVEMSDVSCTGSCSTCGGCN